MRCISTEKLFSFSGSEMDEIVDEEMNKITEDSWLPMTSFTTKIPHWFDNLSSQKSKPINEAEMEPKMDDVSESEKLDKDPFRYSPKTPMLKINGPSLKLPSFQLTSNLKLFSDIEKRTGLLPEGILTFFAFSELLKLRIIDLKLFLPKMNKQLSNEPHKMKMHQG